MAGNEKLILQLLTGVCAGEEDDAGGGFRDGVEEGMVGGKGDGARLGHRSG